MNCDHGIDIRNDCKECNEEERRVDERKAARNQALRKVVQECGFSWSNHNRGPYCTLVEGHTGQCNCDPLYGR